MDILDQYSYDVPESLIAQEPIYPRDASRLLACDSRTGDIVDSSFKSFADNLPAGALLVLNESKVVPARISLRKETGGEVEILFLVNEWKGGAIRGFSDRKLAKGQKLLSEGSAIVEVCGQDEHIFDFDLLVDRQEFLEALQRRGQAPIPPYIKNDSLEGESLKARYQTIFAEHAGSIAAPTASLHFTEDTFVALKEKGIDIAKVTLHVGLGTFAPIGEEELSSGLLHEEPFTISDAAARAIQRAKREGRPIIAAGTTALRAIESAADSLLAGKGTASSTRLFIRKPYRFKIADGLLTNFHVPRSSLMMLVDAFLDYKGMPEGLVSIYKKAIALRYRLFSFGDAMLIK